MTTEEIEGILMAVNRQVKMSPEFYQGLLDCIAAKEALDWLGSSKYDWTFRKAEVDGVAVTAIYRTHMSRSNAFGPTPLAAIQKAMEGEK